MSKNIEDVDLNVPSFNEQQQSLSPRFGITNPKQIKITQPKKKPRGAGKYGQSQFAFIKQTADKQTLDYDNIKISQQQLSKHKDKKSAWISLKGVVYDVTEYLKHHPGGDQLLDGCGKQSQTLFNQHHSWVNTKNILGKWIVGRLQQ